MCVAEREILRREFLIEVLRIAGKGEMMPGVDLESPCVAVPVGGHIRCSLAYDKDPVIRGTSSLQGFLPLSRLHQSLGCTLCQIAGS
jgi:hypothetical protein